MPTELHAEGNGERLGALRDLFELRLSDLADVVGVGTSFLSKVENGLKPLPEEVMLKAAAHFDLPLSFFAVVPPAFEQGIQTHKKSSKATARDEKRVTSLHKEALRAFRVVSDETKYKEAEFPSSVDVDLEDAELVARVMREAMGLPQDGPIGNSIRTLERHGIGVIDALDEVVLERARQDHVGISMPHHEASRPLVAVVTPLVSGVEQRLTVMHELGHLVMDRGISAPVERRRDNVEKRADRFARAMLLPAADMKSLVTPSMNLHAYLRLKADYGVGVFATVKRAEELGLIDSHRAKSLYIQASSAGWMKTEPVEVAKEVPLLFKQGLVRKFGEDPARSAAEEIGTAARWIRRWANLPEVEMTEANVISFAARRQARVGGSRA